MKSCVERLGQQSRIPPLIFCVIGIDVSLSPRGGHPGTPSTRLSLSFPAPAAGHHCSALRLVAD
eukprot:scaffold8065_cov75-Phaeocystis_antarctica.AAC.2